MPRFRAILALGLLLGCQQFDPPPVAERLVVSYPEGFTADFPNQAPGAILEVGVQVRTERGAPVPGVDVLWDDGFLPSAAHPDRSQTDSEGISRSHWLLRSLPAGQFSRKSVMRATIAGTAPLEYRVTVYPCSKGC